MKVRDSNRGGGVAIYVHCSAKLVPLRCYEVESLEAVWAKVTVENVSCHTCDLGSVYILPVPGAVDNIGLFGKQLTRVCTDY